MGPVAHTLIDSIEVPLVQVFAFLTSPGRIPDWLPGCTGVEYEAPLKLGARFTAHYGARVTEFEVVDFTPPATFAWVERGGRKGCKMLFRLDGARGSTAITIRDVWVPPSVGASLRGRFFDKRKAEHQLSGVLLKLRNILVR